MKSKLSLLKIARNVGKGAHYYSSYSYVTQVVVYISTLKANKIKLQVLFGAIKRC